MSIESMLDELTSGLVIEEVELPDGTEIDMEFGDEDHLDSDDDHFVSKLEDDDEVYGGYDDD